jgi:hypothetical protein
MAILAKEKKTCFLAGDFNMNLLHLENDPEIEKYFDLLTNNKFMPLITCPTSIAKTSKTLIENQLSSTTNFAVTSPVVTSQLAYLTICPNLL